MRWAKPLSFAALLGACSAGEEGPSPGTYTIAFPSTAAAVATDTVQLFFFDVPKAANERAQFCSSLVEARKRKDAQTPTFQNAPVNICEMLQGRRPVTIPYGERAVLAVAQRDDLTKRGLDFMVGCSVVTVGQNDAAPTIAVSLVEPTTPVPESKCTSVGDFCARKCPAE